MTDKEKLKEIKKLADAMYYAAFNLTTDASLLRKAMKEYHQFIIHEYCKEEPASESIDFEQELYKAFGQVKDFTLGIAIAKRFYDMGRKHNEPVSEVLDEAAVEWFNSVKYKSDLSGTPINAFKAGAEWQKEQFEKNRLKHCNSITNEQAELEQGFIDQHLDKHQRMPTFLDAIEYGMRLQKEQMIKDATEVTVHIDAGGYPYIPQIELYDYDKDIPLAKEGDKYKVILIKEE